MSVLSYGIQSLHHSQFDIQSHVFGLAFRVASPVWSLEPPSLHNYEIQGCISQFDIQRHHSQLRISEPSSFSTWRSKPCFLCGVQSCISSLTFRAASLVWRSEPSLLSYNVQNRPSQFNSVATTTYYILH